MEVVSRIVCTVLALSAVMLYHHSVSSTPNFRAASVPAPQPHPPPLHSRSDCICKHQEPNSQQIRGRCYRFILGMVSICLAFRGNVATSVLRCHCCYGAVSGRDMMIMLVIQMGWSVTSGTGSSFWGVIRAVVLANSLFCFCWFYSH